MNSQAKTIVVAEWITESGKKHQWGNIYDWGVISNSVSLRLQNADYGHDLR